VKPQRLRAPSPAPPRPVRPRDAAALFREYVQLDRRHRNAGLSAAELARWGELKQRLNATFSPPERPEHEERRDSVRVPVRLRMHFETAGQLRRCLLTNLSRGGVFVSTASPPPIGTQLVLRIDVAEGGIQIEVAGEVVSTNVGPDLTTRQQGMGVRFVDPSPAAQAALDRLYETALSPAPPQRGR
jgi:uncharacterized protein (TIGR02266 family)